MVSTATEWLIDHPGDVETLGMLLADSDVPIRLWTEVPLWMKEAIAERLVEAFSQDYWEAIHEATLGHAETYIEQGLMDGWSIRRIAKEMKEHFLGGTEEYAMRRATNIARTETTNALNGARKASADALKDEMGQDVPMKSTWYSVLGNTTRDEHANLDGVPENKNGNWELVGIEIPWPGHISLPPSQRCNCQCTIVSEFGMTDTEAQQLIEEYHQRTEDYESGEFEEEFDNLAYEEYLQEYESLPDKTVGCVHCTKHLMGKHDQQTHAHGSGYMGLTQTFDTSGWNPNNSTAKWAAKKIYKMEQAAEAGDWDAVHSVKMKAKKLNYYQKLVIKSKKHLLTHEQKKTATAPSKAEPTSTELKWKDDVTADGSGWKKTGGKLGTQPGGTYTGSDGKKYYVKFPPAGQEAAANEVLATKLYKLAGAETRNTFLVEMNGKVGVAAEWSDEAKKANWESSEDIMAATKDFAAHAWLGNWDAVGAGPEVPMDNIRMVEKNGKKTALIMDAGGAMYYKGSGTTKPSNAFLESPKEWWSLRSDKNPTAKKVFGNMTKAELEASAAKVEAVDGADVRMLVDQYAEKMGKDKGALGDLLVARKENILAKAAKLETPNKPQTVHVYTPEGKKTATQTIGASLPPPPEFKSKYKQNFQKKVNEIYDAAEAGDIDKVKAIYTNPKSKDWYSKKAAQYKEEVLEALGSGGNVQHGTKPSVGKIKVDAKKFPKDPIFKDETYAAENEKSLAEAKQLALSGDIEGLQKKFDHHPSPKLKKYVMELSANVSEQLHPPPPLKKVNGAMAIVSKKAEVVKKLTQAKAKIGAYVVLADVEPIPPDANIQGSYTKSKWAQGYAAWSKLTKPERNALVKYTDSSDQINSELRSSSSVYSSVTKDAMQGVWNAKIQLLQGQNLRRFHSLPGSLAKKLKVGQVLQDPGILGASSLKNWSWPGNVQLEMTVGPGVMGLPAKSFSQVPDEREVMLPPNTRLLATEVKQDAVLYNGSIGTLVKAVILPTESNQCCPP